MVFSSSIFLFGYLPVVLLVYFVLPGRARNFFLLVASLFFYAWGEAGFVLVMVASILADYLAGLLISGGLAGPWGAAVPQLEPGGERSSLQRACLVLSVVVNLGILFLFKYFGFAVASYSSAAQALGAGALQWDTSVAIALPLGISFFTFQSMSYTIDVYLGHVRATRNLIDFGTYVSMFPQLVAGPIVRYRDISRELVSRRVSVEDFSYGVQRFVIGLSKKMLVANTFAVPADKIFAIPTSELTTELAWLGVIAYTLQIYFDFSGYSDMAIGLGRMFGFTFLENFNYPYISSSVTEFWRRWHISLSTWFRDYVYIPAGGNRRGQARTYFNLGMVFFLCGLWHGASWNFVVWGLFHGALLVGERILRRSSVATVLWRPLRHVYVLGAVMVGWVFFRADTFSQAWSFLFAMAGFSDGSGQIHYPALYLDNETIAVFLIALLACTPIAPFLKSQLPTGVDENGELRMAPVSQAVCFLGLSSLFILSSIRLASTTHNPFIYFRF